MKFMILMKKITINYGPENLTQINLNCPINKMTNKLN
jgi:hypothetical protein